MCNHNFLTKFYTLFFYNYAIQPEPGSHYTAWSSVSTLIKKQLVTKPGTVPAKYMLTKAGLELAQRLVRVENSANESLPVDVRCGTLISTATIQNSKENFVASLQPSGNRISQKNFASQEVVDFETRVSKPWLLCQEDVNLFSDSISTKEKLTIEREVFNPNNQLSLKATQPSNNYKNNISALLSSDSVLPGNSMIHDSVQSDELRYKHVMLRWSNVFILFQWD